MLTKDILNTTSFSILNNVDAIILVANSSGEIIFANKAVEDILGYRPEELLGNGWWKITKNGITDDLRKNQIADMAAGKTELSGRHLFESAIPSKNGKLVWTQWTNSRTEDGLLIGIAQDITEKKELENELISKNKDNELLLKEIHHRVKNNLQIINSLLNLQFIGIDSKEAHKAIAKCKDRVNSMSLIHTKLYESGSLSSINFEEYLNELVSYISHSYGGNRNIITTVKCQDVFLDIDLSINLGLITNELLTNAYKHAFKDTEEGEINIALNHIKDNDYELVIEDNGRGVNTQLEGNINKSLGLEIVEGLTQQIDGDLKRTSVKGLKYVLKFQKTELSST